MKRLAYTFVLCSFVVTSRGASAQNLLVNPNFDSNVASWSSPPVGTFTWDGSNDTPGLIAPYGSGSLDNTAPVAFGTTFVSQCVAVTAGSNYTASTSIFVPLSQTEAGYAMILANFFNGASCGGSGVGPGISSPHVLSTSTNSWISVSNSGVAPAGAVSAQVELFVNKTGATGSFKVNFDLAFFGPTAPATATPTPTATATATPPPGATATPTATPTGTSNGLSSIPAANPPGLVLLAVIVACAGLVILRVR